MTCYYAGFYKNRNSLLPRETFFLESFFLSRGEGYRSFMLTDHGEVILFFPQRTTFSAELLRALAIVDEHEFETIVELYQYS